MQHGVCLKGGPVVEIQHLNLIIQENLERAYLPGSGREMMPCPGGVLQRWDLVRSVGSHALWRGITPKDKLCDSLQVWEETS
jgi:hypothetical protein